MEETKFMCPKCNGAMIKGFQLDHGHYGHVHQSEWGAGEPKPSFWWGAGTVETKGLRVLEITSYRCEKCGYLESYAK